MSSKVSPTGSGRRSLQCLMIVLSVAYLSPGQFVALAQQSPPPAVAPTQPSAVTPTQPQAVTPPAEAAPKIPNDQLDSLVAPIALYPDPLLAQTLAACTYPLEIVLLQQWLEKNKNLKGKALEDAVQKQPWDPSIQAMAALPEVVKQLETNISWASDLGNAFLNQQSDVMDAVQRMRAKASGAGNLKTSKEQKVESKQVEGKTVVVIEQADPEVVYVPSYNPVAVYGEPLYPYPSMYYPAYVPGRVLAFGAGIALGAAWRNNGWGYNCGWGNNNVNINVNNNFVNHYNKTNVNRNNLNRSGNTWQHNGKHRGGVPYSNKSTAQKFGGTTRSDMAAKRPSASQLPSNRQTSGLTDRSSASDRQRPSASDRQRPSASDRQRPSASDRGNAPSQRPQNRPSGGGDRISSREVSRSPSPRSNNAFSGASSGMNRSSAFASSDRGSRSMSRSGGGFSGGSRGGGSRGGGRRR